MTERLTIALPNVEIQSYREALQKTRANTIEYATVCEFMHPFIEKLAVKHPEWNFVACYGRLSKDAEDRFHVTVSDFDVFQKREFLGKLERTHSRGKYMYEIGNHRVSSTLTRASTAKTSDINKAVKLVDKHFGMLDTTELFSSKVTAGLASLSEQKSNKSRTLRIMWSRHTEHIENYLLSNWDTFVDSIPDRQQRDDVVVFPDVRAQFLLLDALSEPTTPTIKVVVQDSRYLMRDDNGVVSIWDADKLPEHIRHKLGILKLVQNHQAVSDIGYRHSEDTFILLKESHE
jgi:hypothetical protein